MFHCLYLMQRWFFKPYDTKWELRPREWILMNVLFTYLSFLSVAFSLVSGYLIHLAGQLRIRWRMEINWQIALSCQSRVLSFCGLVTQKVLQALEVLSRSRRLKEEDSVLGFMLPAFDAGNSLLPGAVPFLHLGK